MDELPPMKMLERLDNHGSDRRKSRQPAGPARPCGQDDTLRFDDYRAELACGRSQAGLEQDLSSPYEQGFAAYAAGVGFADNPYAGDRSAHLQWENGWSQARDEARRQGR